VLLRCLFLEMPYGEVLFLTALFPMQNEEGAMVKLNLLARREKGSLVAKDRAIMDSVFCILTGFA
jgi:hypothetical protein